MMGAIQLGRMTLIAALGAASFIFVPPTLPDLLTPCEPASGTVAGQTITADLDSDLADYALKSTGTQFLDPTSEALLAQLRTDLGPYPTVDGLARIAVNHSNDLAAILFAQAVYAEPKNARVQADFEDAMTMDLTHPPDITVVFVPGWFYISSPDNGGDFATQRETLTQLGVNNFLIPTDENGSIEDNAAMVAKVLLAEQGSGRPTVVVSASKSGPEVALALGSLMSHQDSQHVRAWLNYGGVLGGSPLADHAMKAPRRWFVGMALAFNDKSWDGAMSLTTARRRAALSSLDLPEELYVLDYIPVPMSSQISKRARSSHRRLSPHGPNDGLALLADERAPNSDTLLVMGVDHYYLAPDIDRRTLALLRIIGDKVLQEDGNGPNAPRTSNR